MKSIALQKQWLRLLAGSATCAWVLTNLGRPALFLCVLRLRISQLNFTASRLCIIKQEPSHCALQTKCPASIASAPFRARLTFPIPLRLSDCVWNRPSLVCAGVCSWEKRDCLFWNYFTLARANTLSLRKYVQRTSANHNSKTSTLLRGQTEQFTPSVIMV